MKETHLDYALSLTDIIAIKGKSRDNPHELHNDANDNANDNAQDSQQRGATSKSTQGVSPYSSDIRKNHIEHDDESVESPRDAEDTRTSPHNHLPYSSDIRESNSNDESGHHNCVSSFSNITNNTLPPYSSDIQDRQLDLLRTIASICNRMNKQDERRPWRTGNIYQQSDFRNDITTPEQLWERLRPSRKAANNLAQLYKACEVLEGYVADGIIEEVAIATTGVLAQVFSKSTASEVIKRAEQLDLLRCTDPHFCPSTPVAGSKRKNGTARKYIVNPRMVELVKRTYRAVSSRGKAIETGKDGGVVGELEEVSSEEARELLGRYNICLSSSLRLPSELTDEQVRACIRARYPQLAVLDTMRERINREYYADKPPLQLRQRIKISRGATGMISKIGTRCTSGLCLLRANDIPHGYAGLTRHMFLHDYYNGRAYYEYDIKSSIYRVARFLQTGEWLEGEVDFYERMSPYEFADEQERSDYKKFAMRLFFGGSPQKITSAIFHELRKSGTELDYSRQEVEEAVGLAQARMFAVVGESIGSEVFLHEGAIYLMVLERLLNMGMRVVSVYDEFIADDPRLEEVCEKLLPVVANDYRERWLVSKKM